ncbi:MAG: hypothetical protein HY088_01990 [Ignavibacteriales bacterium]|nr:hypothetical protein [Ignavibacteriales bacterium]
MRAFFAKFRFMESRTLNGIPKAGQSRFNPFRTMGLPACRRTGFVVPSGLLAMTTDQDF